MSRHDALVRLRHMLDHAREARDMAKGRTRAELDSDRMFDLSLTRLLEVVGEAASRIPKEDQNKYVGIPWPQIVGLRNRIIHGYDDVNFDIMWEIIVEDLPPLIAELEKILGK